MGPSLQSRSRRGRRVFAVSTNLTTGRFEIHRTGPGWQAIRASFCIPGVFPPVRTAADAAPGL